MHTIAQAVSIGFLILSGMMFGMARLSHMTRGTLLAAGQEEVLKEYLPETGARSYSITCALIGVALLALAWIFVHLT